jgi:hypothetical protein
MPAIRHQLSVKSQNLKQPNQNKSQASVTSQTEGGEISLKRLFIQPGTENSDVLSGTKENSSEMVFFLFLINFDKLFNNMNLKARSL